MRKNVASQFVAFQAVSATDGSAVTSGTPAVYYTIDGGSEGTGSGTIAHEGHGTWSYACAQAETNGNHVVFTFVLSGAVSQTVNVYPVGYDETAANVPAAVNSIANGAIDAATFAADVDAEILSYIVDDATRIDASSLNTAAVTSIPAILVDTGTTLDALIKDIPTVAEFEARTIVSADYFVVTDYTAPPAASAIADAVWDEALAGHSGAGSAGLALSTASSGGVDPSVLADAIWDEALSGHSTAGTAGKALTDVLEDTGTTLPGTLTTISGYVDCLPASWVTVPTAAQVSTQVASDLATAHGAGSWATATGFSTHSAADVKTAIEAAGSHLTLILEDTGTTLPATLTTILGDTDEMQKDLVNGGRLDLLIDAIKAKTDQMLDAAAIRTAVGLATANLDTQIATLATAAALAAAKAILDKFNTMVVLDGAVYDFTSDALAAAPGGTGTDPLSSAVPGAYAAGTAGYVIGTYLDAAISGVGGAVGSGADSVTVTWTSEGNPVADGDVWITTDSAGNNVIAGTLQTNTSGEATFQLDAGEVYYMWGQRSGVNSLTGIQFTAVAD